MPEVAGTTLRSLRQRTGLKLAEAADGLERLRQERAGATSGQCIRKQWLANIESGHGRPSEERIHLLADFYGVGYKDLLPSVVQEASTEPPSEAEADAAAKGATATAQVGAA